jgi:hypothetical protein
LEVVQITADGTPVSPVTFFDVGQYGIRRAYTNENTSHSGDNGGESFTRVGQGWTFAANVSFPGQVLGDGLAVGFLEQLIGSARGVVIKFNIGDPEWWTNRGLEPRNYRGKSLAEFINTDNPADGTGTVKLNVAGVGIGLLDAYIGNTKVAPLVEGL